MNEEKEPTNDQIAMLVALNRKRGTLYAGTVTREEKARRRAKNRVARKSRQINRNK